MVDSDGYLPKKNNSWNNCGVTAFVDLLTSLIIRPSNILIYLFFNESVFRAFL